MIVSWPAMKTFVDAKGVSIQWVDDDNTYFLQAFDGNFSLETSLNKNNANEWLSEFETTYKSVGNKRLSQFDTDGANIVRLKAAKAGWSFWAVPIEITTSTLLGEVYCKDSAGVDVPGITCKIYDGSNVEITVPGVLDVNLNTCVKTVVDFEPTFDYEIVGGALRINSNPAEDIRLWIVGAPDIPALYGGSKEFASGINLKFLAPDSSFEIDGRVTKFLTYNPATHQGKMRLLLRHPAGAQVNMQFVIHLYRL